MFKQPGITSQFTSRHKTVALALSCQFRVSAVVNFFFFFVFLLNSCFGGLVVSYISKSGKVMEFSVAAKSKFLLS